MADIVITEFMDDVVAAEFAASHDVFYDRTLVDRPDDLAREASACRALVVRNRTRVTAELLDRCPDLKVIGRLGVGLENIDLAACAARGIEVCPAHGANAVAVAEYVIASMLILMRGVFGVTGRVIAGEWPRGELAGREVAGKTLGLAGFGDISRQVAVRAGALGMKLMAHDPFVESGDPAWAAHNAEPVEFDRLLAAADAISLHMPLTPDTSGLFDAAVLARMKPGALLINTSRGGIVDEEALTGALRSGAIGGAAIDVFAEEPLSAETGARFRDAPNLILTPHIAGLTEEASRRIGKITVANVLRVLDAAG